MNGAPVAVVTGANKGIGFEIARQLAQREFRVVLTARDAERGREAAAALVGLPVAPVFRPLDVTSNTSVAALASGLERDFGRVDVLVNNAGIALDKWQSALTVELDVLRETMETNVYGALLVTQALAPLMRRSAHGRIVNVSSVLGSLSEMTGLTLAYRMSKTALNVMTRVLADELRDARVLVNSMCPGWVRTELGGADAPGTPEQAADTAVWLATLPDDGPTGGFFKDRRPLPW